MFHHHVPEYNYLCLTLPSLSAYLVSQLSQADPCAEKTRPSHPLLSHPIPSHLPSPPSDLPKRASSQLPTQPTSFQPSVRREGHQGIKVVISTYVTYPRFQSNPITTLPYLTYSLDQQDRSMSGGRISNTPAMPCYWLVRGVRCTVSHLSQYQYQ